MVSLQTMRDHHRGQAMSRLLVLVSIKKKKKKKKKGFKYNTYNNLPTSFCLCAKQSNSLPLESLKRKQTVPVYNKKKKKKKSGGTQQVLNGQCEWSVSFCIFINWTNRVNTSTLAPSLMHVLSPQHHICMLAHTHTHSHAHTQVCAQSFLMSSSC